MPPELMQLLLKAMAPQRQNMPQDVTAQAPQTGGGGSTPMSIDALRQNPLGMLAEMTPVGSVAGGAVDLKRGITNHDPMQAGMGILGLLMLGGVIHDVVRGKGVIANTVKMLGKGKQLENETQALLKEIKLAKTPIESIPINDLNIQRLGTPDVTDQFLRNRAVQHVQELLLEGKDRQAADIMKAVLEAERAPIGLEARQAQRKMANLRESIHKKNMADWSARSSAPDYYANERKARKTRELLGTQTTPRKFQEPPPVPVIPVNVANPTRAITNFVEKVKPQTFVTADDYRKLLKGADSKTAEWLKAVNEEVVARNHDKFVDVYRVGGNTGELTGVTTNPYTAQRFAEKAGTHVAHYIIPRSDIALDVQGVGKALGLNYPFYTAEELLVPRKVLVAKDAERNSMRVIQGARTAEQEKAVLNEAADVAERMKKKYGLYFEKSPEWQVPDPGDPPWRVTNGSGQILWRGYTPQQAVDRFLTPRVIKPKKP